MAGKTLNAKNLQALGAERLAELVMDLVQGSAPLKREARAALLEASGSEALAAEVRKRLATIKRARTYVSWRKRKAFLRDLTNQRDIIVTRIAPDHPQAGYDLVWQFVELSDQVFNRVSDEKGEFSEMFEGACESLAPIAIAAKIEPALLADRVFTAFTEYSGYGVFDRLIAQTRDALGKDGMTALKARFETALEDPEWDGDVILRIGRMAIADLEGDPEGYAAQYDPAMRKLPQVAAKIAERFIAANRSAEALVMLDTADVEEGIPSIWVDARIAALEGLDRRDEAQAMRWQAFEASFAPQYLRDYIQRLPDFEDVEAEERGLEYVIANSPVHQALLFLVDWPALDRGASFAITHRAAFDGNRYFQLSPAADALEAKYPLAATILRRVMIEDTLNGGRSSRYKHAARHLLECESADAVIEEYGSVTSHEKFLAGLKDRHGRKYAFWELVSE